MLILIRKAKPIKLINPWLAATTLPGRIAAVMSLDIEMGRESVWVMKAPRGEIDSFCFRDFIKQHDHAGRVVDG